MIQCFTIKMLFLADKKRLSKQHLDFHVYEKKNKIAKMESNYDLKTVKYENQ